MANDPLSTGQGVSLGMNREIESVTKSKKNGSKCHIFPTLSLEQVFFFVCVGIFVILTFVRVMLQG